MPPATFAEVKDWVCRFRKSRRELGVAKGDRAAVLVENCHEYLGLCLVAH